MNTDVHPEIKLISKAYDHLNGFNREKIDYDRAVMCLKELQDSKDPAIQVLTKVLLRYGFKDAEGTDSGGTDTERSNIGADTLKQLKQYAEDPSTDPQLVQYLRNAIGFCYELGMGTSIDFSESVKWFTKAASEGHAIAQNNLGCCYESGRGVMKDIAEAMMWFTKAAKQGQSTAQCNLGHMYILYQPERAIIYYTLAAIQGDCLAQNTLGYCYEHGIGIERNARMATLWYALSKRDGYLDHDIISNDVIDIMDFKK